MAIFKDAKVLSSKVFWVFCRAAPWRTILAHAEWLRISLFLVIIFRYLNKARLCSDCFFVVILYFFCCCCLFHYVLYAFNGTLEPTWAVFAHEKLFNYVILERWVDTKLIFCCSAISVISNSLQPALIDFEC